MPAPLEMTTLPPRPFRAKVVPALMDMLPAEAWSEAPADIEICPDPPPVAVPVLRDNRPDAPSVDEPVDKLTAPVESALDVRMPTFELPVT